MQRTLGRGSRARATAVAAAIGLVAFAATTAPGKAAASTASASGTTVSAACPPATPGHRTCFTLRVKNAPAFRAPAVAGRAAQVEAPYGGYAAQDIQSAYGIASAAASKGTGQTVAVVDAYYDPTAASDLASYRSYFSLPACTTASKCLSLVDLSGGMTDPGDLANGIPAGGWEVEESLDLDATSAACPNCHIILVTAADSSDQSLIAAINAAARLSPNVISLSFGGCEGVAGDPTRGDFDPALKAAGIPITVASGDSGYYSPDNAWCSVGTPNYPASSPFVTAVGGSSVTPSSNSRGWTETAWSFSGGSAGGSGCSSFEPKPAWQNDTGCSRRTVSDVAADADPNPGFSIYDSFDSVNSWQAVGGTSVAAPLVAGIYALAGSPPNAVDGQIWYQAPALNDIASGSNAPSPGDCNPRYLCNALSGYDGPTGMGSPSGPPSIVPTVTSAASPDASTAIPLTWAPPPGVRATSYEVWEQDNTGGGTGAWVPWLSTSSSTATFNGFRGHTYGFAVQYFVAGGASNGAPSAAMASTTISPTATLAMGYTGLYAVDGYGALHPASSPPLTTSAAWPGWNIARGLASSPSGEGGVVLDGFGGLHGYGDSPTPAATAYWPGWDIARAVSVVPTLPSSTSWTGFVLDGFGGLHGFAVGGATAPTAVASAYWSGWDIARSVATFSGGTGGVVLDGFGGVHAFGAGASPMPSSVTVSAYWPGWDIARSVVLLPGSTASSYSGFVLDGFGGLHSFKGGTASMPITPTTPAYWPNWDIARAVVLDPGSSTNGYVVDGYGGFHFFGTNPPASPMVMPNYGADAPMVRGAAAG